MVAASEHAGRAPRTGTAAVAAALAALTAGVRPGGPVSTLEARLGRPFGPAPRWARMASRLPERNTLLLAAVVVAGNRIRTGQPAAAPVARLCGGVLARTVFASVIRRSRPPETWWRAEPRGWSFPSRHTTHAVLISAVLAEELTTASRPVRTAWVCGCAGLVGASRVRLGVHWPSDVAGGVLTGVLWLRLTKKTDYPRS